MPTIPFPRETLLHVVKSMPAAPQILARLGHLTIDPDHDLDEVISLLKCDPALTARIMRVANSAVYCIGEPYSSLEQALGRVGLSEIYVLAGFAAIVQITNQDLRLYGLSGGDLRENSLMTALILEALARDAGVDANEAYSAGLLRSIGKIALEGLTYSAGLLRSAGKIGLGSRVTAQKPTYDARGGAALAQWETDVAGLNNCEAAAFILNEWHFPHPMIAAIGGHYAPESVADEPKLAHLLNIAAGASEQLGFGLPGEQSYWEPSAERYQAAGIDKEQVEQASEKALERFSALHSALN